MDTNTNRLEELKVLIQQKYDSVLGLQRKINEKQTELNQKYNKLIMDELFSLFGTSLQDMQKEETNLRKEFKDLQNEINLESAEKKLPYPEYTEMIWWIKESSYSKIDKYNKTAIKGVLQLFREGDEYPDNMKYGRPVVGCSIVRLCKGNGDLGKKFSNLNDHWFLDQYGQWLPKNVDPNEEIKQKQEKDIAEQNMGVGI